MPILEFINQNKVTFFSAFFSLPSPRTTYAFPFDFVQEWHARPFLCSSRFDWQNQFLFLENSFSEECAFYWLLIINAASFFPTKISSLYWNGTAYTACTVKNYGVKPLVSTKCHNLHSLKGVILLCQSILETIQMWPVAGKRTIQFCVSNRVSTFST